MSSEIRARFRIVTPMFLSGADQKKVADTIRPPSIKGALRFWWRALHWETVLKTEGSVSDALKQLHQMEAELFGAAARKDRPSLGQAPFSIRVDYTHPGQNCSVTDWPKNNTGSGYLGFGLFETNKEPSHRVALRENGTFDLMVRFRKGVPDAKKEALQRTISAFGLLGGLGSRGMRRGFGSVSLVELDGKSVVPAGSSAYFQSIQSLGSYSLDGHDFPLTAFSRETSIVPLARGNRARSVHSEMGNQYKQYRGQEGKLRGKQKIPFGLPLAKVDEQNRRASPLMFHVHALQDELLGVVACFPNQFHPKVTIPGYGVVTSFLDHYRLKA
ncbi:MAG: type III-B CRISPR module RAMP protein Cmr1 [gamma proteobacterium endosymbiont of Lamellibrachia anaximandri]|nr:type III-B CRISPR module RAMP protein Cmr1 [gamma proteobacterium endosymbiont of Lamellibrachia anaximandri]MBL3535494.1 type III-B CRISPR module RAMP protein Cmr1 [gamma proteobacterium endosymbiont of Lamellibrachia anaximandri]